MPAMPTPRPLAFPIVTAALALATALTGCGGTQSLDGSSALSAPGTTVDTCRKSMTGSFLLTDPHLGDVPLTQLATGCAPDPTRFQLVRQVARTPAGAPVPGLLITGFFVDQIYFSGILAISESGSPVDLIAANEEALNINLKPRAAGPGAVGCSTSICADPSNTNGVSGAPVETLTMTYPKGTGSGMPLSIDLVESGGGNAIADYFAPTYFRLQIETFWP